MIVPVVAACLALQTKPSVPRITAVSLFKNGYSFVARELPVSGSGQYVIEQPPMAAHGTFWHLPSAGVSILKATATQLERSAETAVPSLDDLIAENTGKKVTVDFIDLPSVSGTLMASIGDQIVLRTTEGVVFVMRSRIKRVVFHEEPDFKTAAKSFLPVVKLDVEAKAPGTITTVGLEHGLTWVPSYAIDLTNDKELLLICKATVMNELADLDNIEASFITGFPNMRFAGGVDPLTNPATLDAVLAMLIGSSFAPGPMANVTSQAAMSRADEMRGAQADFTQILPVPGVDQQLQELFFYRVPGISLKKGDRAAFNLFTAKAPYEHVYTWDVVRQVHSVGARIPGQDIWHTISFKNTSGKPLTTAVATTFQEGQILGQDLVNYTTAGAETEVRITKSLDIHAQSSEEQVSRDRAALVLPNTSIAYDLITVKGTLSVKNSRPKNARMRISLTVEGELVNAEGKPQTSKTTRGLGEINPATSLLWKPEVKAGETIELNYTYKAYVRTP